MIDRTAVSFEINNIDPIIHLSYLYMDPRPLDVTIHSDHYDDDNMMMIIMMMNYEMLLCIRATLMLL